jgi:hypothetical protein
MLRQTQLSTTALRCLDRQVTEVLDLVAAFHRLSDRARCDGESRTVVVLQRVASDLTELAGVLIPLVGLDHAATTPPLPNGSWSAAETGLAELDDRLALVGLAAEVDAMSPGLETSVAQLLSKLAALYQSSRELLAAGR